MRIRRASLFALFGALAGAPAFAADLPTSKPAPYLAPIPMAYNWTGFTVGVQGGWMGGGNDKVGVATLVPGFNGASLGNVAPRGGFIGLRAGYDWQAMGSPFVVGVAADLNFGGAKRSINGSILGVDYFGRSKIDWDGSLRVRAGYAIDRALIYATGGVAFAKNKYRLDSTAPAGLNATLSKSDTRVGGTIGAGVQYAITNNLLVGLEYRYTAFSKKRVHGAYTGFGGGAYSTLATPNFHRVAATLDWKF